MECAGGDDGCVKGRGKEVMMSAVCTDRYLPVIVVCGGDFRDVNHRGLIITETARLRVNDA